MWVLKKSGTNLKVFLLISSFDQFLPTLTFSPLFLLPLSYLFHTRKLTFMHLQRRLGLDWCVNF
jgi:hypothetical protein